jgi:phosphopantetheinyl transferase
VEIESAQPSAPYEWVANQFLTRRQAVALRALPPEATPGTFLAYWTRKGAYVKAGEGLGQLDEFDILRDLEELNAFLSIRSNFRRTSLVPAGHFRLAPEALLRSNGIACS